MKQREAVKYRSEIAALADGKTIQYRHARSDGWQDIDDPSFAIDCEYRIKPEPKLRPWRPEEVPVGAWLRRKMPPTGYHVWLIVGVSASSGDVAFSQDSHRSLEEILNYEHSTDNGATWRPCGVMEES